MLLSFHCIGLNSSDIILKGVYFWLMFSPDCSTDELALFKSKITNIFSTVDIHIFGFLNVVH